MLYAGSEENTLALMSVILCVSSGISAMLAELAVLMRPDRYLASANAVCFISTAAGALSVVISFFAMPEITEFAAGSALTALLCALICRKSGHSRHTVILRTLTAVTALTPLMICAAIMAGTSYVRLLSDKPAVDVTDPGAEDADSFRGLEALTFDGELFSFSDELAANKVNIINVWATFCGPCIKEMPELDEISREYSGSIGVIGICADTSDTSGMIDSELLEKATVITADDIGTTYTMLIPSYELQSGLLSGVFAYPTTFITDANGNVPESFSGKRSKEQFIEIAEKYL